MQHIRVSMKVKYCGGVRIPVTPVALTPMVDCAYSGRRRESLDNSIEMSSRVYTRNARVSFSV